MDVLLHSLTVTAALHVIIVLTITVRVIMNRPATGVALAWLFLVAVLPFFGGLIYLLLGERRIGGRRARAMGALRADYRRMSEAALRDGVAVVDWSRHAEEAEGLDRLGRAITASTTVAGSDLALMSDTLEMLDRLAADIDAARSSVLMEFYIWNEGGKADVVLEALIRAAERGVSCRLLVDALGGRPWWRSGQPARLQAAGVAVAPALPVGLLRSIFGRTDLRLHRKIAVIDGRVGWIGSMNLVDPRYFKQDAGVGEWVDAMVRVEGPAVALLGATVIGDWVLETGEAIETLITDVGLEFGEPRGETDLQVVSSGPGETGDGLLLMLLAMINAARRELILTTPYFVPDDSLLRALRGAAGRGVRVALVLPERIDSRFSRHASRSYFDELLAMGVEIHAFRGGLLHTKSISVDGVMAMFGTANLDMRSLWLNYEVSLFVYGKEFAVGLAALQARYIADSDRIDPQAFASRPFRERLVDNTVRLISPLL